MNETNHPEHRPTPPPSRWPARLVLLAVAVGIGWAVWHWELQRHAEQPPKPPADPVSDAVIRHALESAGPAGEVTEKTRWADQVPGVDLAALSPGRREDFLRFANAQRCTCDCGYTLAACRNYDAECEVSLPRVQALFDSVRRGLAGSAKGLRERPVSKP